MTKVKMVAVDTVHITAVSPDTLKAGDVFEIDATAARDLEARGLARPAAEDAPKDSIETPETKQAADPENKMDAAAGNKAIIASTTKRAKQAKA